MGSLVTFFFFRSFLPFLSILPSFQSKVLEWPSLHPGMPALTYHESLRFLLSEGLGLWNKYLATSGNLNSHLLYFFL